MPVPAQLKRLMSKKVSWLRYAGTDSHADENYDPPLELRCWIEEKGSSGGIQARRTAAGTVIVPRLALYFDSSDRNVKRFTLRDHFTAPEIAGGQELQPSEINTFFGPPTVRPELDVEEHTSSGDGWVTQVTLG